MCAKHNTDASPANPWSDAGIEEQDIAVPYFAPDRKWQAATVVGLRKPTKDEAWRKLDGRDPFPVFAIIDVVDAEGQDRRWDISSKILLGQLRKLVTAVPYELEVKTSGKPPRKTYEVRKFTPRLDLGLDDQGDGDQGDGDQGVKGGKYVGGKLVNA